MKAWTVQRISRSHSHPWIATDPSCPDRRHPTRWCRCRVFRTEAAARAYAEADGAES